MATDAMAPFIARSSAAVVLAAYWGMIPIGCLQSSRMIKIKYFYMFLQTNLAPQGLTETRLDNNSLFGWGPWPPGVHGISMCFEKVMHIHALELSISSKYKRLQVRDIGMFKTRRLSIRWIVSIFYYLKVELAENRYKPIATLVIKAQSHLMCGGFFMENIIYS